MFKNVSILVEKSRFRWDEKKNYTEYALEILKIIKL